MSKQLKTGNRVAPTSTATLLRTMIFQPTQRPKAMRDAVIETAHGSIRITGRLGQRHADLLDAILYHAEAVRALPGGGVDLLVDPARVRTSMWTGGRKGGARKDRRYSAQQVDLLIDDLKTASITIKDARVDVPATGNLISDRVPARATRIDPRTGEARHLWTVRIGIVAAALIASDIKVYYDPAPLARLSSGVSQALARHVFGHLREPKGGWKIDTLIRAVCGQSIEGQALRNARRGVRADAAALAAIGITIDSDRVRVPGGTVQRPTGGAVLHPPGAVFQPPGAVFHSPGACSTRPALADISDISDTPGDLAVPG